MRPVYPRLMRLNNPEAAVGDRPLLAEVRSMEYHLLAIGRPFDGPDSSRSRPSATGRLLAVAEYLPQPYSRRLAIADRL